MADTRGMSAVHTALHREFRLLPDLVRSVVPGDTRRAEIVGAHAALLCRILHTQHEGEELLLWPRLLERAGVEAEIIVSTVRQQRRAIAGPHAEATGLLADWRTTGRNGAGLAGAFERLATLLIRHMALVEKEVLPLSERHITAAEWHELGVHGMAGMAKRDLPLVFGMALYEGDPEVVQAVLANAPLRVRLAVTVLGRRRYASHARQVHGTVTPFRVGS
ncbi:hemerythrin domain-containing protein [Streptomyces sp. NPDC046977]|uniref:hemerythrin domain-containing protein n=1 Tax=Streptomyces sp. NPDC046977 TaxID=3154703 RepID=UPI0033FE728F